MIAVPILLSLATGAFAASASDWQSRSIYQVLTDRFATSDGSGPSCNTEDKKFCGGTYKGITSHLDYIQGMGFDAVWISPIVKNIDGNTGHGEAYHSYWPVDLNHLNERFGTADDLKELSAALHKRGMYLMVDIVVNHFAATSTPPSLTYNGFSPFTAEADYHPFCFMTDYNNQTQVEQCWLGDNNVALVDINTESENVVNTYNAWIKNLTSFYNIDGIRIDTVKHVRKDFWPAFVKNSGVFSIGEVLSNETDYTGDYTNYMDAVLDYPSWFAITQAFASTTGNIALIAQNIPETQKYFKNGGISTGAFLENHDQPRFQSWTTDLSLVKNAMAYTFVTDGIPILYYGQEQGYTGGNEPANREALWFASYQTENKPLVDHVARLNAARKASIAGDSKFLSTQMKVVANNTHNIAVQKGKLLTALTNVGSKGAAEKFELSGTGYSANEQLVDVLSCTNITADASGNVNVAFAGGNPQVIIPVSQLSGSGLCGSAKSATTTSSSSGSNNGATTLGLSAFIATVFGVVGMLPLLF
ncbi:GH13 alpha-amylase precursor [Rhizoctonia solani AG-1 IB]|uniref:alpha-amylase n=2 Tax=Thanatephorus cucumeris (strain AG1-IB / isolate 7/3/14) TaxID=1108050 RepID=A0A0B7FM60_THACB|nr:GH13 alpha-amylase precursor [Rhizoctonia solani AG-1 IB]